MRGKTNISDGNQKLRANRGDRIICTFWARSANIAVVEFGVGSDSPVHGDSVTPSVRTEKPIPLTPEWKEYSIDLTYYDLSSVIRPFFWMCAQEDNDSASVQFEIAFVSFAKLGHGTGNQQGELRELFIKLIETDH
jgi:hypothetical protein